jgi:hypothetical protein
MDHKARQWLLADGILIAHASGWSIGHLPGTRAAVVITPDGEWHALVPVESEETDAYELASFLAPYVHGEPDLGWQDLERLR